jgi:outer membrane protein assembly factor BamB
MKSIRTIASFAAVVVALTAAGSAIAHAGVRTTVDWPQFRFDDNHTGFNPLETMLNRSNVPNLTLAWQAQLGQLVDFSSPAVVGGTVFIGSTDGVLWAYPASGCGQSLCTTPLWKSTSLAQILDSPTVANGIVYVGSQTSFSSNDGKLYAFDADGCGQSSCQPLWTGPLGSAPFSSSPAVFKGTVYIAGQHALSAFKAGGCGQASCQPLWQAVDNLNFFNGSPAVAKRKVYIGVENGVNVYSASGCGQSRCGPL